MDRLKKPLHHNKTDKECKGGVRGLAGLPQVAAKALEGYSQQPLEVWGLNPKLGSPAYSTRARKGTQITSSC